MRTPMVVLSTALLMMAVAAPALATKPDPSHKVTICHALPGSASHAYNVITVDIASSGYVKGGHYRVGGDVGDKHADGGDIIPPYTYRGFVFAGQNWGDNGEALNSIGCGEPDETDETGGGGPNET